MRTSQELYTNASVVIGGAVCAVLMANNILGRMSDWDGPSVFPGFRIMCGLCFPILYFWVGIGFLIPPKKLLSASQNKGWISLVLIALCAFCYTALTTVKDRLLCSM